MRATAVLLAGGLALAAAVGCNHVDLPGSVEALAVRDVAPLPHARLGLAAAEMEPGLVRYWKRHWVDPGLWTDFFVDDLARELTALGVTVDGGAPDVLVVSLDKFGAYRPRFMYRGNVTLTVTDTAGNIVHQRRYAQSGASLGRAMGGTLYRAKQGLLNDPNFHAFLRGEHPSGE